MRQICGGFGMGLEGHDPMDLLDALHASLLTVFAQVLRCPAFPLYTSLRVLGMTRWTSSIGSSSQDASLAPTCPLSMLNCEHCLSFLHSTQGAGDDPMHLLDACSAPACSLSICLNVYAACPFPLSRGCWRRSHGLARRIGVTTSRAHLCRRQPSPGR